MIAVGDGRNDIDMLEWAAQEGRGVAMGQAPPDVRIAAGSVAGSVADDGLADVLESLLTRDYANGGGRPKPPAPAARSRRQNAPVPFGVPSPVGPSQPAPAVHSCRAAQEPLLPVVTSLSAAGVSRTRLRVAGARVAGQRVDARR